MRYWTLHAIMHHVCAFKQAGLHNLIYTCIQVGGPEQRVARGGSARYLTQDRRGASGRAVARGCGHRMARSGKARDGLHRLVATRIRGVCTLAFMSSNYTSLFVFLCVCACVCARVCVYVYDMRDSE